ncbi:DUF397 domain-containing protein [Streptomyces sp. PRKS01-29]|nr:DUF397 domain-containing protein [Streptomyces sabulosicollis]
MGPSTRTPDRPALGHGRRHGTDPHRPGGRRRDRSPACSNPSRTSEPSSSRGCPVEVALRTQAVHIRDPKDTERAPLTVSPEAWAAFIAHI